MDEPLSPDDSTAIGSSDSTERREELVAIGHRLRAARHAAGFTQQDLADRIGVNRVEISMIENGSRELGILRLHRLAEALGVSSDSLLGRY